jgi:hypothetical protein
MAALDHAVAGDEILKNSFANFAFENFEIAAYKSLLTIAEAGGFSAATMAPPSKARRGQGDGDMAGRELGDADAEVPFTQRGGERAKVWQPVLKQTDEFTLFWKTRTSTAISRSGEASLFTAPWNDDVHHARSSSLPLGEFVDEFVLRRHIEAN